MHASTEIRADAQFSPVITISTIVGTAAVLIVGILVGIVLKAIKKGTGAHSSCNDYSNGIGKGYLEHAKIKMGARGFTYLKSIGIK